MLDTGLHTPDDTPTQSRKEYIKELEQETFDQIAKIVWLIKTYPGWSEDGTFTFPDGDTWQEFNPDGEQDG